MSSDAHFDIDLVASRCQICGVYCASPIGVCFTCQVCPACKSDFIVWIVNYGVRRLRCFECLHFVCTPIHVID